jgi:hypothetical protein
LDHAGYTIAIAGKFLNAWKPENDPPHFDHWAIFNPYIDPGYYNARFNVNGAIASGESLLDRLHRGSSNALGGQHRPNDPGRDSTRYRRRED